jgi:hypothetical protein
LVVHSSAKFQRSIDEARQHVVEHLRALRGRQLQAVHAEHLKIAAIEPKDVEGNMTLDRADKNLLSTHGQAIQCELKIRRADGVVGNVRSSSIGGLLQQATDVRVGASRTFTAELAWPM